ncbi:hypothetical protein, partial [Herminiimonas sp. CN]|uniref:hypothetical protein n=1 Tax=Herminiimonas sp. CN TaxID=1349818 RepID=UPI001EE64C79
MINSRKSDAPSYLLSRAIALMRVKFLRGASRRASIVQRIAPPVAANHAAQYAALLTPYVRLCAAYGLKLLKIGQYFVL